MGIGIGLIYGHKEIDFSKLNFNEQFNGYGFNQNLPTGETALSNMKGYISTSAGLLYSFTTDNSSFDFGVSAFHLNKPKQTTTDDPNQYLAPRYVVHGNYETYLTDQVILSTNGIYQTQAGAHYFSIGGALGYIINNDGQDDLILNGGLWYWSSNAVVPYVGFAYRNFQFGFTYDVTVSKLSQAAEKPQTFELSLIIRGDDKPKGIIPCPWK